MHIVFTTEELRWINKNVFDWTIKKGCPDEIRRSINKKIKMSEKNDRIPEIRIS